MSKSLDLEKSSSERASISHASQTGLDLSGLTTFTLEAHFRLEALSGTNVIMSKYNYSSGNRQYGIWLVNSGGWKIRFRVIVDGTEMAAQWDWTPTAEVWYHASMLLDTAEATAADRCRFRLDSVDQGAVTYTSGTPAQDGTVDAETSEPFLIGGFANPADYFDGEIAYPRVWRIGRNDSAVAADYLTELVGTETGLAGYWKFNDDLLDETSNSNDLTHSGTATYNTDLPFAGVTEGTGTSAGTSTASGVGQSTAEATGTSAGTSTASGVGESTAEATGTSAGVSTASGVGESLAEATGTSTGTSSASGVGQSIAEGTGTSAGISTSPGVGQSIAEATGTSAGTSTATGVGESIAEATGTSAGTSTATGVGESLAEATGTSAGTSAANGIGRSIAEATGTSAGTSTATGVGIGAVVGVGTASGSSTAAGVGQSLAEATGTAAGTSAAAAIGSSVAEAVGSAAGTSTALAVSSTEPPSEIVQITPEVANSIYGALVRYAGALRDPYQAKAFIHHMSETGTGRGLTEWRLHAGYYGVTTFHRVGNEWYVSSTRDDLTARTRSMVDETNLQLALLTNTYR